MFGCITESALPSLSFYLRFIHSVSHSFLTNFYFKIKLDTRRSSSIIWVKNKPLPAAEGKHSYTTALIRPHTRARVRVRHIMIVCFLTCTFLIRAGVQQAHTAATCTADLDTSQSV